MLKCLLAPAALLYKAGGDFPSPLFDWGILKSEVRHPGHLYRQHHRRRYGQNPDGRDGDRLYVADASRRPAVARVRTPHQGVSGSEGRLRYRDVGDEPLQIKLKFPDTVVAVCEKRADGIRRICAEHPDVDLIVMDDGFQHRYVEPKVNIVMIDATRPVQHDRMLPLGTLRDLPEELHRAHYFVVDEVPREDGAHRPAHPAQGAHTGRLPAGLFHPFREFHAAAALPGCRARRTAGAGAAGDRAFGHRESQAIPRGVAGKLRGGGRDDARRPSRLQSTRPEPPARIAGQVPGAVIVTTEKDAVKMTNRAKIPEEIQRGTYTIYR